MLELLVTLIPALPLLAAAWLGITYLIGSNRGEPQTARVAVAASLLALLLLLGIDLYALFGALPHHIVVSDWLSSGDYRIHLSFSIDRLSLLSGTLAALISFLVIRFSVNYMHREAGFQRFFMLLSLFNSAMLLILLGGNAAITFAGWELAGVSSYLLIAYAFDRTTATANATRAFVTNRIGDAGFILSIYLSLRWFGNLEWPAAGDLGAIDQVTAGTIAIGFVIAALAKSAAVPFAPWISRALEGPTPSSAIFYGSLMVHAGIYLLLRLEPLLVHTPAAMIFIGCIGVLTILYGYFSGLVQTDVKSSLIFSTSAQIGIMLLTISLGGFEIATWHMAAHMLWRAYQFLSAPALMQMVSGANKPVSKQLQRLPWLYTASLQRFWLDPIADSLLTRPTHSLAREIQNFDEEIINRFVGLPGRSRVLASPKFSRPGQQGYVDVDQNYVGHGQGALGKLMQSLAGALHWFEERLVLQTGNGGLLSLLQRLGLRLQQMDQLLGTPRYLWLIILLTFVVII